MSVDAGIDLNLNAQGYLQQSNAVLQQTASMDASLSRLAITSAALGRSLDGASFSQKHAAALGAFAGAAATAQQNMSSFAATAAVTNQNAGKLEQGIRSLARQFPTGQAGATQTVAAINGLGIAAAGSESKVIKLAKTMQQLQFGNGGSSVEFAQGMIQLQRTFGDRGIDPRKVQRTADALTTVSKTVGSSAQSVLDFSNAIAPMTQAAGISKEATLGIGAAFTSIGQDGTSAATAINKMLSDMSKAVRDGGPEMNTYANIVGTTADNFERMFKMNPTEAITQVTNAIGKAGTAGPRILENLGLEGVRSQRALQALSASGGLGTAITTAVDGRGNGSTKKASDAALEGVLDKFQEVANSAGELAQAIGRPLLGPLGLFAKMISTIVKPLAAVASSGVGQGVLGVAAAGFLGRRLLGAGVTGALAKQAATSGPVGALAAGFRSGRGDQMGTDRLGRPILGAPGFIGRQAGNMERLAQQGRMTTNAAGETTAMGRARGSIYGFGQGFGKGSGDRNDAMHVQRGLNLLSRYGPNSPEVAAWNKMDATRANGTPPPSQGGNPIARGVRGLGRGIGVAANAYMATMSAAFTGANTPAGPDRDAAMMSRYRIFNGAAGAAASTIGTGVKDVFTGNKGMGDAAKEAGQSLRRLGSELGNAGKASRVFGQTLGMMGGATGFAARTAGAGAGLVGRAAMGIGGAVGGMLTNPMMLMMGGVAAGGWLMNRSKQSGQEAKARSEEISGMSTSYTLDSYNESLGRASSNTTSFGESMKQATSLVTRSVTDMSTALKVSTQDITTAQDSKQVTHYAAESTPQSIAAQVRQMAPGTGLDPQQMQSIKTDLVKQFGPDFAQKALTEIGKTGAAADLTGNGQSDLVGMARDAANINLDKPWQTDSNRTDEGGYYGTGSSMSKVKLKGSAKDLMTRIASSMSQRYSGQSDMFGGDFAQQTRLQDINAVAGQLSTQGNEAAFNEGTDTLAQTQLGLDAKDIPRITSSDVKKYGSYIDALAAKSPKFAESLKTWRAQGISTKPGDPMGLTQTAQTSPLANFSAGTGLEGIFDNTMTSKFGGQLSMPAVNGRGDLSAYDASKTAAPAPLTLQANKSMQASLLAPDNQELAGKAQTDLIKSSMQGGQSVGQLAHGLTEMASKIDDSTNPAFQRLIGTLGQLSQAAQVKSIGQSSGQTLGESMSLHAEMANTKGQSQEAVDTRNAGKQGQIEDLQQLEGMVKQKIQAQRQYEIQSRRMTEDYNKQVAYAGADFARQQQYAAEDHFRQREYATEDYQKSVYRSGRDFQKQQQRSVEDYELNVMRTEADYQTQRSRQVRDFELSMTRGEQDYNTQRMRSMRDFNKQIAREVEDNSNKLYDPFQRIQTQMVWDTQSLLGNMKDQNEALVKQQAQLQQARKMGVTTSTLQALNLNDPANAQQLNQLVNDVMSDPKLAKQLNQAAKTKQSVGGILQADPANKDIQRAKADFAQQLADMETDYRKSVARARADMAKSVADQEADFGKTMARQASDFQKMLQRNNADFAQSMSDAAQDFETSMSREDAQYATSVARASAEFATQMGRMEDQYQTSLKRMEEDVTESQKEIVVKVTDLWDTMIELQQGKVKSTNKFMREGFDDTLEYLKDPTNTTAINSAYKNLFPYDLSKVFGGTGGGDKNPATIKALLQGSGGASADQWPVQGATVTQGFGGQGGHPGIDLAVAGGTPINNPIGGIVTLAGWNDGYGNCVVINDGGGRSTLFGHMRDKPMVKEGDYAKAGAQLGVVGSTGESTGNHLHLETALKGQVQDPATTLPAWKAEEAKKAQRKVLDNYGPWGGLVEMGIIAANLHDMYPNGYEDQFKGAGLNGSDDPSTKGGTGFYGIGKGADLVKAAMKYLGTPYTLGGDPYRDPFSSDCSGLVDRALADIGHRPPGRPVTYDMVNWGSKVNTMAEAKAGDLLLMEYGEGGNPGPGHVAIYIEPNRLIHDPSPGSSVSYSNIWQDTSGRGGIRRVLADEAPVVPAFNGSSGPGTPIQMMAQQMLVDMGWGDQWGSFNSLEMGEAGWNPQATNSSSGAYGLAQALPPEKYSEAGSDWRTNPATQLRWMMGYIRDRYGSPDNAWATWQSRDPHWYGTGGVFGGQRVIGVGEAGKEAVIPLESGHGIQALSEAFKRALSGQDVARMRVAGGAAPVTYVQHSEMHDHSTNFTGPVKVESNDPNDMARKLAAKRREKNLVSSGKR